MPRTTTRRTTIRTFASDLAAVLNQLDRDGKPVAHVYIPDHEPPAGHVSSDATCRSCPRANQSGRGGGRPGQTAPGASMTRPPG